MLFFSWNYHNPSRIKGVIWSDQEGYYVYLPATFIYHGFQGIPIKNCCRKHAQSGEVISKYTYGVALMESPFFLGSHLVAKIAGQANGFSPVYARGIMLAAVFYTTLGLWLLGGLLRQYYQPLTVILSLGTIAFGTNLFYYTIAEAGMSHAYSFCLFALFLTLFPRWLNNPTLKNGIITGLISGLIIIVRPTNIMILLAFPLWEIYTLSQLKFRMKFLFENTGGMLMIVFGIFIMVSPQLAYWNHLFDSPVYYSYEGEGFTNLFSAPMHKVLLSYQNGWLAYTPLAILFFPGILLSWKNRKHSAPLLFITLILATYVFASWWAWWFGGAFGHRCYVEYYALLCLPLGALLEKIVTKKGASGKLVKACLILILIIFIQANLRMTYLYQPPWDGPDWNAERYREVWQSSLKFWEPWPVPF